MHRIAVLGLLSAATALQAQAPAGSKASQPLRVTAHLVEVSVIAQTKQGETVTGLTGEDFAIFDEGRPEQIAFFRAETSRTAGNTARPLPPNVYSNRPEELGDSPTAATVILFDGLNTRFTDQAYARQQILQFMRGVRPGERVALYVMGRGPRVLQDFTSDTQALENALASYKGTSAASLDAPLYDPSITGAGHFNAWLGELTFGLYDYYGQDRAFRTVRALIAIADHVERLPGRKNLIWVSGSFPVSIGGDAVPAPRRAGLASREASPEVERAARALSKANLAIYPVDARGLIAAQEYVGSPLQPEVRNPDTAEFATMRMLAERTGGRAFYNNNDLTAALRQAADDARMTYLLGYYPSHHSWKGKFRKIELQLKRPEVELHYRRGYFAQPDEPAESWYRERVLDAALWSPLDATGVGLTVAARRAEAGGIDLNLQVDARDITFRPKDGNWECGLDVWLVQLDPKERQLNTDARTNNLRLDQATFDRVMQAKGLALVEHLNPAPDALLLRILVRDVSSGALGSLTVPVRRLAANR